MILKFPVPGEFLNKVEPLTWHNKKLVNEAYVFSRQNPNLCEKYQQGQKVVVSLKYDDHNFMVNGIIVGIHFSGQKVHYDVAFQIENTEIYAIIEGIDGLNICSIEV